MKDAAAQSKSNRAEDRAPQRCDPSADPVAKTEEWSAACQTAVFSSPLRDWRESEKPSRHDAAKSSTGCPPQLANTNRLKVQFPLNQDSPGC